MVGCIGPVPFLYYLLGGGVSKSKVLITVQRYQRILLPNKGEEALFINFLLTNSEDQREGLQESQVLSSVRAYMPLICMTWPHRDYKIIKSSVIFSTELHMKFLPIANTFNIPNRARTVGDIKNERQF